MASTSRRSPARLRRLAAVAAVLAAAPSNATAAAPWSVPVEVAQGAHATLAPGVAFTARGRVVLAWVTGQEDDVALATAAAATDAFGRPAALRPASWVQAGDNGDYATYGRRRLIFSGVTGGGRIAVVFARIGARGGHRETIGPPMPGGAPRLVANARGDVAVAALVQARRRQVRTLAPYLMVRRRERFGAPIRIAAPSRRYTGALDVSIDDRGDVLAAWQRGRSIYARIRTADGRLGPAQRLGRTGSAQISSALAPDRSAIVAWEGRELSATEVRASRALPGGRFSTRPHLLEHFDGHLALGACSGASRDMRLVRVAVTPRGKPVVAWTARESARTVVRAAAGHGRRGFTYTPLRYGRVGRSCLDGLDTAPDGAATVLWSASTLREGIVDLAAAVSTPGVDGFGAPEEVATGARAGASLGVDPHTGAAVAAWVRPTGALAYSVRTPDR